MGAQGLVRMVDDGDVLRIPEIAFQHAGLFQHAFHLLHALFGEDDRALLLVELDIGLVVQLRDEVVDGAVKLGAVVGRA